MKVKNLKNKSKNINYIMKIEKSLNYQEPRTKYNKIACQISYKYQYLYYS